ncbi:MAG: protein-glutamate O-methyltransferase CheR [Deltaproteobacteria bacterium]|nr:protein-glutamate O-methyltransferase CheR [Deltaproteobacteria bacterium]
MASSSSDHKESWAAVREFMQRTCGVVMAEEQKYLLEARLQPVVKRFQLRSITEAVQVARTGPQASAVTAAVIDAMTTHETFFFRDDAFWRTLHEAVLPRLNAALGGTRRLRVWSAACSTGQEVYSLAMLLAEGWPALAERTELVGTDVSELAVAKAREGVYNSIEVNRGLGAARLVKHFEGAEGGFRVKEALRKRVSWQVHNLLQPGLDPVGCDLVLCRNVLIYFNEEDRKKVLRRLRCAAHPMGFIGVGSTELIKGRQLAAGWYANSELGE